MKKWQKVLLIILAVFIVLGVIKNPLIKAVVTVGTSQVLGTRVHIRSLGVGVFRQAVHIRGLKIYNPKGFPQEAFVDIPEVKVEYRLGSLFKGKLQVPLIILNLKEVVIVKNKEGVLNLDGLKVTQQPKKEEKAQPQGAKKSSRQMSMQIDEARINLGRVIVKDYTQEPPAVLAYPIGVNNKVYKDLSAEQLATLIMMEAMGPTAFKSAGVYAAATILGVGFLPAGIAGVLLGKDTGTAEYNADVTRAYRAVLGLLGKIGQITKEDTAKNIIQAKVSGCDITAEIMPKDKGKTEVKVKARQMMVPRAEVAEGVLYQLSQMLK